MILLLLACKEPKTVVVPGADGRLSIELVNPTAADCTWCDPFTAVDTLRIDVFADEELVATGSYSYPEEPALLPQLDDFGVVRIEIAGLSAGRVESGGRTPEIALDPGTPQTVQVAFLPVNAALPLAGDMTARRSQHVAVRRHDGAVALLGGHDATRTSSIATIEVFSPTTWTFGTDQAVLPAAGGGMAAASLPNGDLFYSGGTSWTKGVESAVASSGVFLPDSSALVAGGSMALPRVNHCLAPLSATQVLSLGGSSTNLLDLASYDSKLGWTWAGYSPSDLDATAVLGCAATPSGAVFVLGSSVTNTGLWAYDTKAGPGASFNPASPYTVGSPLHVAGAVLAPLSDGTLWIASGADPSSGALTNEGRVFTPATLSFALATGVQEPRYQASWDPWIREDWFVVGCGWQDTGRVRDEPSVELVNPRTGEVGPDVPLDRQRNGCTASSLPDGSILIAGGFSTSTAEDTAAAIVVPWPDELPRDTGS